ncbi:MAG TPA: ABC transporter ATP-binding protein [Candidatus Limnocylindrales bacterium]|nr:ABC transporter ATP-binding protein [Candidatus Limnocylindrales bacterium]
MNVAVDHAPIQTSGLTKHYGAVRAIEDLDLEVQRGEVFGFLGPNGAGKTPTIRALLHFIFPTRGRATILGLDCVADSVEIRRRIGYMPSEYAMYPNLTGAELLRYFANLRGGVDETVVASLAERLEADLSRKISDLSTGNKQKVALIQAFMSKPDLVILDEPSSGLDPLMQQELQEIIREVRDDGRTVFLSSHSLAEVERVADRVAILREGHLVVVERVDTLKDRAIRRLDLEFEGPIDAEAFRTVAGVRSVVAHGHSLSVTFEGSINALLRAALDHQVVNLNSREADLEEIFLTYYRGDEVGSASDAG